MYNKLDQLKIGGSLLFFYPIISNNCSFLLIESIVQCFESVSLMPDRLTGYIWGNAYICKNYKGKKQMIEKNTLSFFNFIVDISKLNYKTVKNFYLIKNEHNALLLIKKLKMEKEHIKQQEKTIHKHISNKIKKLFIQEIDNSIKINIPCTLKYVYEQNKHCQSFAYNRVRHKLHPAWLCYNH